MKPTEDCIARRIAYETARVGKLTVTKGFSAKVPSIKRRFEDAKRLIKKVPVNELFESIIENSPFVGNVLERNWAKVEGKFKGVVPVQESEFEGD